MTANHDGGEAATTALDGRSCQSPLGAVRRTGAAAPSRQDILTDGLRCYYADGHLDRPHCQRVAVVAYGPIVLCVMCDAMRSAVGRTDAARKVPGAELGDLIEAADELKRADKGVNEALQRARRAGASRGQIGDALGITRQAAQQRFGRVAGTRVK